MNSYSPFAETIDYANQGGIIPLAPVNPGSNEIASGAGGTLTPLLHQLQAAKKAGPEATKNGLTWGNAGNIMEGVASLGGLWAAFQQNKLAKEQLAFAKSSYATNLGNSVQSYNTALEGRVQARYAQEGKTQADANAYVEANKVKA